MTLDFLTGIIVIILGIILLAWSLKYRGISYGSLGGGILIIVVAVLVAVFLDFGDGVLNRAIYTKEERVANAAYEKVEERVLAMTRSYKVRCPLDKKRGSMTDAEKAEWMEVWGKKEELRVLPGSDLCYIYR
jgi:hypothetical protein